MTKRNLILWSVVLFAILGSFSIAVQSPLLAWRRPIYILAGFSGVLALGLLQMQPLLAVGILTTGSPMRNRRAHQWIGGLLVCFVALHIIGLWITSPPDVIDVFLFRSPTPFAVWGALAMWSLFLAFGLMVFRRSLAFKPAVVKQIHLCLVAVVVVTTILHAVLIEGTMGQVSKWALCASVLLALILAGIKSFNKNK